VNARLFHARMRAAAEAFKAAGGKHPRIRVEGETIEIVEAPPNSTESDEAARTQALFNKRLGDAK
jgi:hypothetical protein